MSNGSDREQRRLLAEAALDEFLARAEAGDTRSFESWVGERPELACELRELHAVWQLLESEPEPANTAIEALGHAPNRYGAYRIEDQALAEGGMSSIFAAQDQVLQRELVLKILRRGGGRQAEVRRVARFLAEARVTSRLSHPGIVPVYEIGLDAEKRPYIAMKRVNGRDLATIFELVFAGQEGWNETRALGVILKACEAIAYAQERDVLHRDLKPANVMVGEFGEVYVMDWGLARVLGTRDEHDLRLLPEGAAPSDSPLVTLDGDVLGTPAYMPPEQARGAIHELTRRADVYSIGALLYHLLAREAPYTRRGERQGSRDVLERVLAGPPPALRELRRDAPAELVAICEKAMARETERRYPSTLALAQDLRAYLEHRVVQAYQSGATAEFRKWVGRNRELALASAAAILIAIGGLAWVSIVQTQARRDVRALALANASKAAEPVDSTRALLLAAEAAHVEMTPDVESQLHSALVGSLEVDVIDGRPGRLSPARFAHGGESFLTACGPRAAGIWKVDGGDPVVLDSHGHTLTAAAFSLDDSRVVTGYEDGSLVCWDRAGKELGPLAGHTDSILAIEVSPRRGGGFVTTSLDGTARLWRENEQTSLILGSFTQRITALAWSRADGRLAIASEDGDVRQWDASGKELHDLPHESSVLALAYAPDGARLLTGTRDGHARLWNLETLEAQTLEDSLAGAHPAVTSAAFSGKDGSFALGRANGALSVWNPAGTQSFNLPGHTGAVDWVEFSDDGDLLASAGSTDCSARVWELHGRGCTILKGHTGRVERVHLPHGFNPARDSILTASVDGSARTWRLKGVEVDTYRSVPLGVRALSVSSDSSRQVLVVRDVGPARLLDAEGKTIAEYGVGNEALHSARLSASGGLVVTASTTGTVRIFDGSRKDPTTFETHVRDCWADFAPDSRHILTWGGNTAELWDLSGGHVRTFDGHEGRVLSAAISPDMELLLTGCSDGRARLFERETARLALVLPAYRGAVVSVAFSHHDRKLLTAGDQSARILNRSGDLLRELRHMSATGVALFSDDDRSVAVGCADGSAWLWNAETGRKQAQLPGHSAGVIAAAFEKDGHLRTACADGNVRIRATTAEEVLGIVERKIQRLRRKFTHAELKEYSALLGHEQDALLAAYLYVEPRLEAAVVVEDVVDEVTADAELPQDIRVQALSVLAGLYDDPVRVRERAWEVVREAGRTPEEYRRALGWARIADRTWHEDFALRVLLGVAQHRVGDETAALQTLRAVEPRLGGLPETELTCLAALILVQHAQGRAEGHELERFETLSRQSVPFPYRGIVDEARNLH